MEQDSKAVSVLFTVDWRLFSEHTSENKPANLVGF